LKLQNEFVVAAPLDRTWRTLLDVERVAGCLPGATIEPVAQDGLYRGAVRIKAGPVTMAYNGTVRLADVDADDHVASFDARAKETKGTGTAAATIRNRLRADGDGTRVTVETDLNVTGRPAQFGRGLMEDVAGKMLGDFAGRLERLVLDTPEPVTNGAAAAGSEHPSPVASPAAVSGPSSDDDGASLDVGSLLLRGYGRRLALAGGVVGLVVALVLVLRGRSSKGLDVALRYRR
jgi:carbon monoxide dehydrogenase subunit G